MRCAQVWLCPRTDVRDRGSAMTSPSRRRGSAALHSTTTAHVRPRTLRGLALCKTRACPPGGPGLHPEHPTAVEGCRPASRSCLLELLTCGKYSGPSATGQVGSGRRRAPASAPCRQWSRLRPAMLSRHAAGGSPASSDAARSSASEYWGRRGERGRSRCAHGHHHPAATPRCRRTIPRAPRAREARRGGRTTALEDRDEPARVRVRDLPQHRVAHAHVLQSTEEVRDRSCAAGFVRAVMVGIGLRKPSALTMRASRHGSRAGPTACREGRRGPAPPRAPRRPRAPAPSRGPRARQRGPADDSELRCDRRGRRGLDLATLGRAAALVDAQQAPPAAAVDAQRVANLDARVGRAVEHEGDECRICGLRGRDDEDQLVGRLGIGWCHIALSQG